MRSRVAASVGLIVLSLANSSGAQQDFDPLIKLDPTSRRQVQALIDSAKLAELPWKAVWLKAVEGVNKKAEGKKVLQAVRTYYATLVQSKAILGPLASREVIETGADALTAKVSPADLALFRVTDARRPPTRALVYLSDLIDKHHVPYDDAVTAFVKLWKDGAADSDFDDLWRGVDQDILSGANPKSALQNRMRIPRVSKPPAEQDEGTPHS